MNLCNEDHAEACYEGRNCPACALKDEKDDEIRTLEREVKDLESKLEEATNAAE